MSSGRCRSCKREPVPVALFIPADLSHTGADRYAIKPIDACIADIVRRLNAGATEPVTRSSCCGHGYGPGEIILADGRKMLIDKAVIPKTIGRDD